MSNILQRDGLTIELLVRLSYQSEQDFKEALKKYNFLVSANCCCPDSIC